MILYSTPVETGGRCQMGGRYFLLLVVVTAAALLSSVAGGSPLGGSGDGEDHIEDHSYQGRQVYILLVRFIC